VAFWEVSDTMGTSSGRFVAATVVIIDPAYHRGAFFQNSRAVRKQSGGWWAARKNLNCSQAMGDQDEGQMRHFKIELLELHDGTLMIVCSGNFGYGSGGNVAASLIERASLNCLAQHPDEQVKEIVLDLSAVDYVFGDGPATCLDNYQIWIRRIERIRLIASSKNRKPLESLIACYPRTPRYVVVGEQSATYPGYSVEEKV
jgi:hypothetical protein